MRRVAVAAASVAAALLVAGPAAGARFAVGVDPSAPLPRVAERLRDFGPVSRKLAPMHVLVVEAPGVRGVRRVGGVRWVEWLGSRRRKLAFVPSDPLVPKQWYLTQDHAFDFWPEVPVLPPVKVAIVDSGIDLTHPDFAGRILLARSFVGGSANDVQGHGTFVAGEIAASLNNAEGIAGIAFNAQLLVGRVVRADGSVSLEGEAQAIRWAVDQGARVINLSLGGLRDPRNPGRDTYSDLEAAAVAYAASKGAVLVAAVGNSDQAPTEPWPYASYPAALPHVLGVSALARDGSVSAFSDRDLIYNDIAAPGEEIVSTVPRSLTKENPSCLEQGYSSCAPKEYRRGDGTSFAAPQVSAAAALVLAQRPGLSADQVVTLLERTADDVNASNGCPKCPLLRDSFTGWGRLNVAKALGVAARGAPPVADRFETNDDAGADAQRLNGASGRVRATIDYWDDATDVYSLALSGGDKVTATLAGVPGTNIQLRLWSPQTPSLFAGSSRKLNVARSLRAGSRQALGFAVPRGKGGRYYVEVRIALPGSGPYTLTWRRAR